MHEDEVHTKKGKENHKIYKCILKKKRDSALLFFLLENWKIEFRHTNKLRALHLGKVPNPANREVHIIVYVKTKELTRHGFIILFSITPQFTNKMENMEMF